MCRLIRVFTVCTQKVPFQATPYIYAGFKERLKQAHTVETRVGVFFFFFFFDMLHAWKIVSESLLCIFH